MLEDYRRIVFHSVTEIDDLFISTSTKPTKVFVDNIHQLEMVVGTVTDNETNETTV